MKVLVAYESMFGNTEAVARAVADGLGERMEVELHDVATVTASDRFDLIVVGGPTHAFSMSRPSTRADAITQGATRDKESIGLREWLGQLPHADQSQSFASFDTRVEKVRHLPGSAAAKAARIGRRLGYAPVGQESFYVSGTTGPLVGDELERARAWGVQLGTRLATHISDQAAERARG